MGLIEDEGCFVALNHAMEIPVRINERAPCLCYVCLLCSPVTQEGRRYDQRRQGTGRNCGPIVGLKRRAVIARYLFIC